MGMFTELVLKCGIKSDAPEDVKLILRNMFNGEGDIREIDNLPEHEFFKCERFHHLGSCSSYYHIPWATSKYAEDYIFSRSDLKNYDNEISKFIDWLMPYIDEKPGYCIGWSWYEEETKPTLLFKEM